MISIAIPTYNYNVYPLVREIDKQAKKSGVDYQILVYDDASTKDFNLTELLSEFDKVTYKKLSKNIGRIAIRRLIAKDAKNDYILFIDADIFPTDRFFFTKLIKIMSQPADVYFGGINVPKNPFNNEHYLRWKYGKYRESKDVNKRKKDIYNSIISGALLINKDVFLTDTDNFKNLNKYGLDSFMSYYLRKNKRKVIHYHNPVIHLGLEKNEHFLNKTRKALETYRFIVKTFGLSDLNKITKTGSQCKKILTSFLIHSIYKTIAPLLEKNLTSKRASLFLFDVYKLLYYCQLK